MSTFFRLLFALFLLLVAGSALLAALEATEPFKALGLVVMAASFGTLGMFLTRV